MPNEKNCDERDNFGVLVVGFRIPSLPRPEAGGKTSVCEKLHETEKINQRRDNREEKRSRQRIALRPMPRDLEPVRWRF